MGKHEQYMLRCLELANNGLGKVAPNPMVGCVVVHENKIIGEGFHKIYGGPHAEVNAIESVKDKKLLSKATLYVNLEPCAHFGKTPPCADLITHWKIPYVIIGCVDTFSKVAGKGIEKLIKAGIDVKVGILEKESRDLNRRFFTFHEKKRPYIILKWAETLNGFFAPTAGTGINWISGKYSRILVHKWRSEEAAIMAGTNTVLCDNPKLNVRSWTGKNPLRVVIDKTLKIPGDSFVMDDSVPSIVFSCEKKTSAKNTEFITLAEQDFNIEGFLKILYKKDIQSIIIEGGAGLLSSFIKQGIWDEARIFRSASVVYSEGIKAPEIKGELKSNDVLAEDELLVYRRKDKGD